MLEKQPSSLLYDLLKEVAEFCVRPERLLSYFVGPRYFFFDVDFVGEDLAADFFVVVAAFLAVVFLAPPFEPDDLLADDLVVVFFVVAIFRSCSFLR